MDDITGFESFYFFPISWIVQISQRSGNHNIRYNDHIKKDTETYQLELLRSSGPSKVELRIIIHKFRDDGVCIWDL